MNFLKSISLATFLFVSFFSVQAQINPDAVYKTSIHSVRFHMYGDQETMPIYKLNSADRLVANAGPMCRRGTKNSRLSASVARIERMMLVASGT